MTPAAPLPGRRRVVRRAQKVSPAHVARPLVHRAPAEPRGLAGRARLVGPARERPVAARGRDAVHGRRHPRGPPPRAAGRAGGRPRDRRPHQDPARPPRRRRRGGRPGARSASSRRPAATSPGPAIVALRRRGRRSGDRDRPHRVRLVPGHRGPRRRSSTGAGRRRAPTPSRRRSRRARRPRSASGTGRHARPRRPPRRAARAWTSRSPGPGAPTPPTRTGSATPLALAGSETGGRFTTRGPLVVDADDLGPVARTQPLDAQWRAIPDVDGLPPGTLDAVAAERRRAAPAGSTPPCRGRTRRTVATKLPDDPRLGRPVGARGPGRDPAAARPVRRARGATR